MRFCLYAIIALPLNVTPHEFGDLTHSSQYSEVTWVIEDTLEWESYLNNKPATTSSETSMIIIDGLVKMGYRVKFVKATRGRAEIILRTEENVCMGDRIKTPDRESYSFFSAPHDLYLGQQLYRLAQSSPLNSKVLNNREEVIDLASLFYHYPNQVLATASGTSYGIKLDKQIAALNPDNVFIRSGGKRAVSLAKMLLRKRIDYIIYYPQEINEIKQSDIKLESYTIAGSPLYFLGHVACSKSKAGKQIITHIDDILKQAYRTKEFYQAHEKWLMVGDINKLRQYFNEVFNYLPSKND
jgi:uncharacterized protein (TIGR02285 family)